MKKENKTLSEKRQKLKDKIYKGKDVKWGLQKSFNKGYIKAQKDILYLINNSNKNAKDMCVFLENYAGIHLRCDELEDVFEELRNKIKKLKEDIK